MRVQTIRGGLQIAALLLIGVPFASASTVTYTANIFSPAGTEQTTPWSTIVQLPRFDLGAAPPGFSYVLDAVSLTLNYTFTGEVAVENRDLASAHSFTNATSSVPLTVTGPGGALINATAVAGPISSATSTPSTVYSYPAGFQASPTFGEAVPAANVAAAICAPFCVVNSRNTYAGITGSGTQTEAILNLLPYQGTGLVNLNFSVLAGSGSYAGTEVLGSGHLLFSGAATAGGNVQLTYTYHTVQNPIPEPVTIMLVGTAMLGLGVAFRRKKRIV